MFTYTDALQVLGFAASEFPFANTQNSSLGFIVQPYPPPLPPWGVGVWANWRDASVPGPHAPNVWHTVDWSHTPTDDNYTIDGVPIAGISPDMQAAYEAQETGFPATMASFYELGSKFLGFDNTATVSFGPIRLGTTPGGTDILNYDPAVDGLAPWTGVQGNVAIVGGVLQCGPANVPPGLPGDNNGVWLEFPTPPATFTFKCAFSVGVTSVTRSSPPLPPPDDVILVQAALPETLLPEGYRVEFGVYNGDGTPFAASAERDATLAFTGLDDDDGETF